MSNAMFKRGMVGFWFAWWLIAFLTDLLGGMKHAGALSYDWISDSNYPFLVKSLALYHAPGWLTIVFFIGITAWSLLAALLFCHAFFSADFLSRAKSAFIISLGLWLAFFLADQIIMNFDLEQNHMVQGGFELLSFLAMYILPEK
jgi:hypothetical protein